MSSKKIDNIIASSSEPNRIKAIQSNLLSASDDLFYVTGSDAPYEFTFIPYQQSQSLQAQFPTASEFAGLVNSNFHATTTSDCEDAVCKSMTLEDFFKPLIHGADPYGQKERYLKLRDTLTEIFGPNGTKVYKIGMDKVEIWIVGSVNDALVGLSTYAVET